MSCSIYYQLMLDRKDYIETEKYYRDHGDNVQADIDRSIIRYIEKLAKKLKEGEIGWY